MLRVKLVMIVDETLVVQTENHFEKIIISVIKAFIALV